MGGTATMKSLMRKTALFGAAVSMAATLAACGSSSANRASSSSAASTSGKSSGAPASIKATWTYTGPQNDGGYNTSQELAMNAMSTVPHVTASGIYNLPYSSAATAAINEAIAKGSNMIVDTMGLGSLLTDACKQHPNVYCYSGGDASPQPSNSVSWWLQDWKFGYIAGVAAGLMTKTNVLGYVAPSQYPGDVLDINAYALGCQSVDPKCTVKVIFDNSYFNPPADTQATETLISSGADVIRNWVDDPSFCKVAAADHVYAVGNFNDFHSACASSVITSTVWNFSNYFKQQASAILAGKFHGSGSNPVFVPVTNNPGGPHLGTFGSFVPASVKSRVLSVWSTLVAGKNPIVGPIRDQSGSLKFSAGQTVSPMFMFTQWNWFVKGVTASS